MSLLALQDSVDPDQDPDRLQFVLWSRGSEERFTLQAPAASVRISWVEHLSRLVEAQRDFLSGDCALRYTLCYTIHCTIHYATHYATHYAIQYTAHYTTHYTTLRYTLRYTLCYIIHCTLRYTLRYTLHNTIHYTIH